MADIGGKPMIEHVYNGCSLAIPTTCVLIPYGDPLKKWLNEKKIRCFEGPEKDVLKRYLMAMDYFKATHAIRVTSDCPLLPMGIICETIIAQIKTGKEFISNCIKPCVDGHEVELFSKELLRRADTLGDEYDHEHVTTWMKKNLKDIKYLSLTNPYLVEWFPKKLSVDTEEDLTRIRSIYEKLTGPAM